MPSKLQQSWIAAGYELFAKEGPKGLKVQVIARQVKKSKSSFYHHFADMEIFTDILLQYHLERATIIAEKENASKNIDPDLINILVEVKQDLLFNRQLRVNRTVPAFKKCFEQSNQKVEGAFLSVWARDIGLPDNTKLAGLVLGLMMENFYLQITEETLTYPWLQNYFREISGMIMQFKKLAAG
jgi:AcrR family transcriptional regulator